jgi:hypothetical protein
VADEPEETNGKMTRQRQRALARAETKRNRPRPHRLERGGHFHEDDDVVALPCWSAFAEDGRKASHDALIAALGPLRVSGVSWREATGDEAHALLDEMTAGEMDEAHRDHYRRIRAHLREYGGWVVVALAKARKA